jgi:hypothetical protein
MALLRKVVQWQAAALLRLPLALSLTHHTYRFHDLFHVAI